MSEALPIIVIDTREQNPYEFILPVKVTCLKTGDYSISGLEHLVVIERKSLSDLIGSLTSGRAKFEREFSRGRGLDYFALIIEADVNDVIQGRYRLKSDPEVAIQSLQAFSIRYRMPVFFAGDRQTGQRVTKSLFVKYHREIEQNWLKN